MEASRPATINIYSPDLENVGQGHRLQKSYLGYYMTYFKQSFTKMIRVGLAARASHQLTYNMWVKVNFTESFQL